MPGFGENTQANNQSFFEFDSANYYVSVPRLNVFRSTEDLRNASGQNMTYVSNQGWQLDKNYYKLDNLVENASTNYITTTSTPINFTVPANFHIVYRSGQNPAPANTSSAISSGDPFYQLQIPSNTNWNDPSNFLTNPYSSTPNDTSVAQIKPICIFNQSDSVASYYHRALRFRVPGSLHSNPDIVLRYYFAGPYSGFTTNEMINTFGTASDYLKTGFWCLTLHGDGTFTLYNACYSANGAFGWVNKQTGAWANYASVINTVHTVIINVASEVINFKFPNSGVGYDWGSQGKIRDKKSKIVGIGDSSATIFITPDNDGRVASIGTTSNSGYPAILESRVDTRLEFQFSQVVALPEGYFYDNAFTTTVPLPVGSEIIVQYSTTNLDSTNATIVPTLFDSFGNSIVGVPLNNSTNFKFTISAYGARSYNLKTSLTLVDPTKADPGILGYLATYNGLYNITPASSLFLTENPNRIAFKSVNYQSQSKDITQETLAVNMVDLTNTLSAYSNRSDIRFTYGINYNNYQIPIMSGWFRNNTRLLKAYKRNGNITTEYSFRAVGEWQRLSESLTVSRLDFANSGDFTSAGVSLPYKVTDAIRELFYNAGYTDAQLDIPDLQLRMFPSDKGESLLVEPQSKVLDVIQQLINSYLGYFLIFDPTITPYGMFRVMPPKVAPYTPLASFISERKDPIISEEVSGFIPYVSTLPFNPQNVLIRKGSISITLVPPEANTITVYGPSSTAGGDSGIIQQIFTNSPSINDPTSPDYEGRIVNSYIYLPSNSTALEGTDPATAVNYIGRRLYSVSAFSRKNMTFQAPLVFVLDPTDPLNTNPRMLRYYDVVNIDNIPYFVKKVGLEYTKDAIQFCTYEVEMVYSNGGVL